MNEELPVEFDLFAGEGELRALMRASDWSRSPLGHPHTWPSALRTVVGLMLDSKFPMFVAWGPELGFLYNDAYTEVLGVKHPAAIGRRFYDIWSEIWPDISPLIDRALAGEATYSENLPLLMLRKGHEEQTWFTFSYSPVRDERGRVAGMFCACTETTPQILAERRQSFRLDMADRLRGMTDPHEITAIATALLGEHLGVARVGYAEINEAERTVNIARDWTSGTIGSLAGEVMMLDSFGPAIIDTLRAGHTLRLTDIASDPRSAPYASGYASIQTRSVLAVPLIRNLRLTAVLYLHEPSPRVWTQQEAELAEEVAERTWAAVERARAEENRRQAEEALSRQLAAEGDRLRALFEQAPSFMAVMRGPEHVFELANSAFMHLIGPREVLGKSVRESLPELESQGFCERLDEVYRSGKPFFAYEASVFLQRTPQTAITRFVDFIYQPVMARDGTVSGIFIDGYDVTERKLAGQALRESEARYRALIETISMVVWRTDSDGAIMGDNGSWSRFTGLSREDCRGSGWLNAIHPDDRERALKVWQRCLAERSPYEAAYRLRRHDGEYRNVIARAAPVWASDGELAEWIGNCTDVTEAKRSEEALRIADRRKDEFLAMLAHELRNPLAPIRTAAQILKLIEVDEPRVKQTSDIIARQVEHMTSLVDDLLDVSRVTRGLITLDKEALDLQSLISSAVEQVRALVEARRHRLTVRIAAEAACVRGDRTRLVQVITNLLNNAAKYSPEGGEILLDLVVRDDEVWLSVCDRGIGMASDLLPHVFDLFVQAERSPDRSQGGLGLGLALVKSLVELHDGSVAAYSEGIGKGSRFVIRLPLLKRAPEKNGPLPVPTRSIRTPALHVMIVDDNTDAAQSLAMLLETEGHRISVEYSAHTTLEHLERSPLSAPHVFLLDIGLPDMDGYELARRLRMLPRVADATLIALTGYGRTQDRERSRSAGFDHHLVKPVDAAELATLLSAIAASRSARGSLALE